MLRDYQIEMKTRLMEAWKAHRSVMVQMPTGTGKTHLLASVVSGSCLLPAAGYGLLPIVGNWWRKWRKRWLNMVSGGRILRSG